MDTGDVRKLASVMRERGSSVEVMERNHIIATALELGAAILDELRQNAKNREKALKDWNLK